MHRSHRLPSLCLALTLLLLAAPVLAERLEETFEETLDFASGDTLQVDNTNGNIKIESWDRDEVLVEAPSAMEVLGMLKEGAKDWRICAVSVKPARRIS